ncbi:hypothetical protein ACP70R_024293 [Stipagrostis hirtigluma subsp. patula]
MAGPGCPGREERTASLGKAELECGDISASQEDLLARSSFLGGGGDTAEEEAEVFSTPPLTHQDQPQQGQGQGEEEEEDAITMCTLPSTQPSPPPPPPPADEDDKAVEHPRHSTPQKRRVCTRKVRGARTSTRPRAPTAAYAAAAAPALLLTLSAGPRS